MRKLVIVWGHFRTKIVARKFLQNVGVLTTSNIVGAALNFVQGILIARWLGPELYGVVALVMTYPNLVHGFFDTRSVTASVKYLGEYHALGQRDRALAMCKLGYAVDLGFACVSFLVLVLTAHFAARSIAHDPAVGGLMVLYGAALIPRALAGTSNAILATLGHFPFIASIEVVSTAIRTVLIVGLVLAGWQVAGVVWANAMAATATGLLYGVFAWVFVRRAWGGSVLRASLKALKGRRREIFSFLAYTDMGELVGIIPKQLDILLLGYFRNPTEVGYYKLAKSLSSVSGYLMAPLKSVAYPELARLWGLRHKRDFAQKVRKLATRIAFPLGGLVLLGSGVVPFALPLLVGEIYVPAVRATQLLIIASAISIAFFWVRLINLVRGDVRQLLIVSTSVTFTFALVYPFSIREWGHTGAAGWMLAMYVVGYSVSGFWLWKRSRREKHDEAIGRNDDALTIQKAERLSGFVQEQR